MQITKIMSGLALVFDTETTGLNKTKILSQDTLHLWPFIVQFSYIMYDLSCNSIAKTVDVIIKMPDNVTIPEEATNIHGITNEMSIRQGEPIEKVLSEYFHDLQKADIVIGHNIQFDLSMIKVELLRIIYNGRLTYRQSKIYRNYFHYITNMNNTYCTMHNSVNLCNIQALDKFGKPYLKYPKLVELHQKLFSTTPNNLHNSLIDILATLRCYMKIQYDIDLLEISSSFKRISKKIKLYAD